MKQNIENYITKITSDRTGAVSYQVCIPYTNLDGYKDHYTATFSVKKYGGNAREALKAARNDRDKQLIIIESNPIAKFTADHCGRGSCTKVLIINLLKIRAATYPSKSCGQLTFRHLLMPWCL